MKVAISVPDKVFAEGEAMARRLSVSRSKLYALALAEFTRRHSDEALTEAMNAALDAVGQPDNRFSREAARRVFAQTDW